MLRRNAALAAAIGAWLIVILAGFAFAERYAHTAGTGSSVTHWPDQTSLVYPDTTTLVMFVEAGCPCSEASLSELNLLLQDRRNHLHAHIVVEPIPGDVTAAESQSLVQHAQRIAPASLHFDTDGRERRQFDAHTSGETQVFAPTGALLFRGGITAARGHEGDNVGYQMIASLTQGVASARGGLLTTPVYGCHFDDSEGK